MNNAKTFLESLKASVKNLEERYHEIYKISKPHEYLDIVKQEQAQVLFEIEKLETLKRIYSVLDSEETKVSRTALEYLKYLDEVNKGLEILHKTRKEIEEENNAELQNIKLLLEAFKKNIEILEI